MDNSAWFAIPNLLAAKRVLCVQPHYDDNDIGAGGTVAALRAGGATVYYLTVTDDLGRRFSAGRRGLLATARLRREQQAAGALLGVSEHYWLGYPDAEQYDYYELRRNIIKYIRLLRPDFLLTVDPWLPYEAHRDHVQTGLAVAEASYLQGMTRPEGDPEVDRRHEPYGVTGVGFYFTQAPNTLVDISAYRELKYQALATYETQISPAQLAGLTYLLDMKQREYGAGKGFAFAEGLKVLAPGQMHCNVDAWRM